MTPLMTSTMAATTRIGLPNRELKRRGVVFEDIDLPGMKAIDGIAEVAGNYPSKGASVSAPPGSRTAWATCSGSASRSADLW